MWDGVPREEPAEAEPSSVLVPTGLSEVVATWFTLAFLAVASVDDEICGAELQAYRDGLGRMGLVDLWMKLGTTGVLQLAADGMRARSVDAVKALPRETRVQLGHELLHVALVDQGIASEEYEQVMWALDELDVEPAALGLEIEEAAVTVERRALWVTLAFLRVASSDGEVASSETAALVTGLAELGLPNPLDACRESKLHQMLERGVLTRLGDTIRDGVGMSDRIALCRLLRDVVVADGRLDSSEVAQFFVVIDSIGVSSEAVGFDPHVRTSRRSSVREDAALWFTLAFMQLSVADGDVDVREMEAWYAALQEMQLADMVERHGLERLADMANTGKRQELGQRLRGLSAGKRRSLAKGLVRVVIADGHVDTAELENLLELIAEIDVDVEAIGLRANA